MNKIIKSIAVLLSLVFLFSFSSCKNNSGDSEQNISAPSSSLPESTNDDDPEIDENDLFISVPSGTAAQGTVTAPDAKSIKVNKALAVYKKAITPIKQEAVGFTKTQWQDFNDIATGDKSGIANMVLTIVSKNVIKNNSLEAARANSQVFAKGDFAAAKSEFPVFNSDSSFILSSADCISHASYVKRDSYKEYYIYFNDSLNPVMGEDGFGGIMTPLDRDKVFNAIRDYGFAVKKDTLKFDCTFKNSYMMFRVDNYGKLIYLEQNHYADIDAKAEVDLYVASTNFLNGRCSYEEHYIYSDFNY